ncbi:MAG: ABC transporter permease [Chloroflexi bacterium]|nr:ABC transporter permease [Chloroflexota bacterium]
MDNRGAKAISKKMLDGIFTVFAAVSVVFFSLRLAAGDPLEILLSQGLATRAQIEELRVALGLDRPLFSQYLDFLRSLLRGDLGKSLYTGRPVISLIKEQYPQTIELAFSALLFAIGLGLVLGVAGAILKQSHIGKIAEFIANVGISLPVSFTGILALFLWLQALHWATLEALLLSLKDLLLPALILGFASAGALAKVVQSGLAGSLREPYMLAARARGIRPRWRFIWHALRPSLPPVLSIAALEAAFLFSGTVITETVFARPGLGRMLVNAILQGDYAIVQGIVVLAAALYVFTQALSEILSIILDPRLARQQ